MAIETKRRRAHVVLSDDLLAEIDALVGARGRSRFLEEAAGEKLQQLRRVAAYDDFVGSLADVDIPGWETDESAREWVRKLRQEWSERPGQSSGTT